MRYSIAMLTKYSYISRSKIMTFCALYGIDIQEKNVGKDKCVKPYFLGIDANLGKKEDAS